MAHIREPNKHTCPKIDVIIRHVLTAISYTKSASFDDEDKLRDRLADIEWELSYLEDDLNGLRYSNDELRSWGLEEAYNYDALIEDGKTLLNLLDDYENSGGNRGVYAGEKWDKIMRLCKVSFARNVGEADNG